ncbi:MAG: DNA polymerase III subunit alpha [Bacilli bacterium]|nr:DNA polymerase III subunit alpha [Bacilli bacterium]
MYTPLYVKTDNSLLTSMIKVEDLISFAKENNIKSLTITDNNMYGVMDFYHACINNDIKPIIGLEVTYKDEVILLYAKNYNGYLKLNKIVSNEFIPEKDDNLVVILPYASRKLYSELKDNYTMFLGYSNLDEKNKIKGNNKIYINETLCLTSDDEEYLKYLYGIKNNKVLLSVDKEYSNNYLHTLDEVIKLSGNDMENNYKFTEMCNIELKFNNDLLPKYPCEDAYAYLKKLCIDGLKNIFGNTVDRVYQERLKYELGIIKEMGFCNYFLVVWDYVKFAKENGILVGPGRGSAAGSLVAYLLNITTVDPIKYNLLFERFLNPERVTMPDIDVDFEATRREEVVEYCRKKYGEKKVVPIIAFGTMASKQAVRDVARVMDINLKDVDMICKKMDARKSLKENLTKVKEELYTSELKQMYKIAMKFENIKRHATIHASGIVISKVDLDEIIPLDKGHEFYTTGYEDDYLEKIGLYKMDFLAIRNLTLIDNVLKDIKDINFDDIPLDDSKAIKVFHDVYTLGIFQFESTGMMNFLAKLKVNNFTDIYNAIAFYRPGPMDSIDTYLKRREGKEKIEYIVPALEPILKETAGIMVYQEQVMNVARVIAGYSLGEADILRRAMSKKKEEVLIKEKDKFITRSVENGYTKDVATKIYDLILKFASYGFNKSHSVVYALISYRMAYLKAHYPNIFLKHLLNSVIGDDTKTKSYIYECKKYAVLVVGPSINNSSIYYEVVDNKIVYPFTNIKGFGRAIAEEIVNQRESKYTDIYDFFARCHLTKKVMETLILVGALDEFGYTRKTLIQNLDVLLNYGEVTTYLDSEYALKPEIVEMDEYPRKKKMADEHELLGLYLTDHPVTEYRNKYKTIPLSDISKYFDRYINIIGLIDRINITKSSKPTCFITISDEVSNIDLVLFNKTYEQNKLLNKGDVIEVNGKVEKRFDKYQIIVSSIKVLE